MLENNKALGESMIELRAYGPGRSAPAASASRRVCSFRGKERAICCQHMLEVPLRAPILQDASLLKATHLVPRRCLPANYPVEPSHEGEGLTLGR